jgi:hypothetical protein
VLSGTLFKDRALKIITKRTNVPSFQLRGRGGRGGSLATCQEFSLLPSQGGWGGRVVGGMAPTIKNLSQFILSLLFIAHISRVNFIKYYFFRLIISILFILFLIIKLNLHSVFYILLSYFIIHFKFANA